MTVELSEKTMNLCKHCLVGWAESKEKPGEFVAFSRYTRNTLMIYKRENRDQHRNNAILYAIGKVTC
jgi:hypothetical protein